jgi:hypothetical protein
MMLMMMVLAVRWANDDTYLTEGREPLIVVGEFLMAAMMR